MKSENTPGRGRPKGTGLIDLPALERMADLLIANPSLRPTTAIRKVISNANEADIRRLQRKWRILKDTLLSSAKTRAERRSTSSYANASKPARANLTSSRFQPASLAAIAELSNSPVMKAIRELQNTPTMRFIREIQNSPVMKLTRELNSGPTARLLNKIKNNPAAKIARQQEEFMRRFNLSHDWLHLR